MAEWLNIEWVMTLRQIAEHLDMSRDGVNKWSQRYDDFPEPVATDGGSRRWYLPDVHTWAKERGFVDEPWPAFDFKTILIRHAQWILAGGDPDQYDNSVQIMAQPEAIQQGLDVAARQLEGLRRMGVVALR